MLEKTNTDLIQTSNIKPNTGFYSGHIIQKEATKNWLLFLGHLTTSTYTKKAQS